MVTAFTDVVILLPSGPVWTANFDDIPMDTGTSTASGAAAVAAGSPPSPTSAGTGWSSSPSNSETGWADFSSFTPVR